MDTKGTWYGPTSYTIRVQGDLSHQWSQFFEGMTTSSKDGITKITGSLIDQSALHGILNRIRDLGLQLIAVEQVDPNSEDKGKIK